MRIIAVIPARYGSTRLPGKPLLDICGKPMIQHVYEHAKMASRIEDVLVATDDSRIERVVNGFGGKVCMTDPACASGSDRLLEVAGRVDADVYINIQGDEPLLEPSALDALASCMLSEPRPQVATLACRIPMEERSRVRDPNLVKVVLNSSGNALYFSRSPIPYARDPETPCTWLAHIGVYAYTKESLRLFGSLPPSPLEQIEKLEQLRFLQAGVPVRVLETVAYGPGVDTLEDLERVRAIMGDAKVGGAKKPVTQEDILRNVRLIITDIDGVLTDGTLTFGESGECLKHFNVKDGYGVMLARKYGVQIAVLSGRDSPMLRARMKELGITCFRLGQVQKQDGVREILAECGCQKEEAVFLGDDVIDIPAFRECALGIAVADAHNRARQEADLVLATCGGRGALREILDKIFEAKGL